MFFSFFDDIYLLACSLAMAQQMTNDVIHTLAGLGLSLNPDKIKWIVNRHSGILNNQALIVCNVKVYKSDSFVALGSVITADLKEGPAYMHRISQSWRCYQKWATVLESNAPLDVRLTFWSRTVLPSLSRLLSVNYGYNNNNNNL